MSASPKDTVKDDPGRSDVTAINLSTPFILGEWRIDSVARIAARGDEIVKIDPRNMRVLQILVERHGQIVPQRELEALAWEGVVVTPDSLYQSIRQLRHALRDTKSPARYIETVPRRGYRMLAELRAVTDVANPISLDTGHLESLVPNRFQFRITSKFRTSYALVAALGVVAVAAIVHASFKQAPDSHVTAAPKSAVDATAPVHAAYASAGTRERVAGASFRTLRARGGDALIAGKPHEAIEYFKQALQRQVSDAGENNEHAVRVMAEIANAYQWLDDESSAYEMAARAVAIVNRLGPGLSQDRMWTVTVLTDVFIALGEYATADALIADVFAVHRRHLGPKSPELINPMFTLSLLRSAQGRLAEAEQLAREAETLAFHVDGDEGLHVANAKTLIAVAMLHRRAFEEAEKEARLAMEIASRHRSTGLHPYEVSAKHFLGEALMGQGEYARAEIQLQEELNALEETHAVDWRIARAASALGEVYMRTHRFAEAERYLSLAKKKLTRTKGWPIEREVRNLSRRLEELEALRPKQVSAVTD